MGRFGLEEESDEVKEEKEFLPDGHTIDVLRQNPSSGAGTVAFPHVQSMQGCIQHVPTGSMNMNEQNSFSCPSSSAIFHRGHRMDTNTTNEAATINTESYHEWDRSNYNYNRNRISWKNYFLIVGILIVLQSYIPPPPSPNETWNDFLSTSTQGIIATVQNMSILVIYVSQGCIHNIYTDIVTRFHMIIREGNRSDTSPPCPLLFPARNNLNSIYEGLTEEKVISQLKGIVGQEYAMKHTVESLSAWQDNQREISIDERYPLSVLFTGPAGVGKFSSSEKVAQILLSQCGGTIRENYDSGGVLVLQGMDYSLDEVDKQGRKTKFMTQKILDHVHNRKGSGTVIIIKHVENVSSEVRSDLIRLMKQSTVSFFPTLKEQNKSDSHQWKINQLFSGNEVKEAENISLANVVFIFTTDVGTNKLFDRLLKSHGFHDISTYQEISKSIVPEVEKYFGKNAFNEVVPFWPLRYSDMQEVAELQFNTIQSASSKISQKWKKIHLIPTVSRYLISPEQIEYFELKLDEGYYVFAKRGGHDLSRFNSIINDIEKQIASNSFYSKDDVVILDYDGDGKDLSMKVCSDCEISNVSDCVCSSETVWLQLR